MAPFRNLHKHQLITAKRAEVNECVIHSYTLPSASVSKSDLLSDLPTVKHTCASASVRPRKLDLFLV